MMATRAPAGALSIEVSLKVVPVLGGAEDCAERGHAERKGDEQTGGVEGDAIHGCKTHRIVLSILADRGWLRPRINLTRQISQPQAGMGNLNKVSERSPA